MDLGVAGHFRLQENSASTKRYRAGATAYLALPAVVAGAAPTWMIHVTTTGSSAGTALVYGREVGVQFLQIPAGTGSSNNSRVVPARLAKGELHLVSLSLTSLHVEANGPPGSGVISMTATSPIITAFQGKDGTGVRFGW